MITIITTLGILSVILFFYAVYQTKKHNHDNAMKIITLFAAVLFVFAFLTIYEALNQ